jgi:membrane protein
MAPTPLSQHEVGPGTLVAKLRGWIVRAGEVLIQSFKDFLCDNGPVWAAAISYYTLLSLFPLLLGAASLAAFFIDPIWAVDQVTRALGDYLPLDEELAIAAIVKEVIEARGSASLLSIAALLWASTQVFGAMTQALNIAYDVDETYGFLKSILVRLLMLVTIGVLFVVSFTLNVLVHWLWRWLNFIPDDESRFLPLVVGAIPALMLLVTFFLIYRFVPRRKVSGRAALAGAGLSTGLFLAARPLFLGYVEWFAHYNLIYGSITLLIVMILWAWLMAMILLFGGEVAAHTQAMWLEGKPARVIERRHEARAPVKYIPEGEARAASDADLAGPGSVGAPQS